MRSATRREKRLLRRALERWRGPRLEGGTPRERHLRPSSFDPNQLAIGVGVELEHTRRPELALEIAMAHLFEHRDYYDRLERYVER